MLSQEAPHKLISENSLNIDFTIKFKKTDEIDYSAIHVNTVTQKVIDSDWVPGVVEVLSAKRDNQDFFIVTATPQKEIEYILEKLDIASVFSQVVGAPENKINGINMLIDLFKINPSDALMIGDSSTDYIAADSNKIEFVLRRTTFNYQLQEKLDCHMINDYTQNNTFKGNAR